MSQIISDEVLHEERQNTEHSDKVINSDARIGDDRVVEHESVYCCLCDFLDFQRFVPGKILNFMESLCCEILSEINYQNLRRINCFDIFFSRG